MEKILRECSLNELYKKEERMKREIQELDSNMQYLVYENHSKFIKASETIREMKDDFQRLEDDMTHLGSRMEDITTASGSINRALADRKREIVKLCGVHHLLKKLQFLFELPSRLNKCMEMGFYAQAVKTYVKASRVLAQYQHMPSFSGIQSDCQSIVARLKSDLKNRLDDPNSTTSMTAETVDLLLALNEPPSQLCHQFLDNSQRQLEKDLAVIAAESEKEGERGAMDIVEYVNVVCSGFLANLSLVIQSCYDMFVKRHLMSTEKEELKRSEVAQQTLCEFIHSLMAQCLANVRRKLEKESVHLDSGQLVKAVDKLSGKLQAMNRLLPAAGLEHKSKQLTQQIAESHTSCHAQRLRQSFSDTLTSVRQALVTARRPSSQQDDSLNGHCTALYASIKSGLESSLGQLKAFIEPTVSFSDKRQFRETFCLCLVREGIVISFINHVLDTCHRFTETGDDQSPSYPPSLVLILSRLVHDMDRSTICYLVSYGDERFPPREQGPIVATPTTQLLRRAGDVAQELLDHYVKVQGQVISQMIRKSVETRDWLHTLEPRSVRSGMKRVVEEVTLLDKQVATLYEDGAKKEQGSEGGSRHTYSYTQGGKGYPYSSSAMDSSLLSNIQKLFYERIEVFATVEFFKLSIVTGIIKIVLKALLECVRLRTFGKFGLQQMQVDSHYLQLYLWRYVSDEQ
ncbi:Vacuolar protein sorting-associated protein 51 homolog [Geodia barretti]|nr:Vacuolar protein sorting-associated protein 51 homolog [Geodia barretti]